MNFPDDLLYSPDHLWAHVQEGVATVGPSDFAQEQMGRVQYVDLPGIGLHVVAGREMGFTVEAAKSMTDIMSPVTGTVVEVNRALADDPAPVNDDPYGAGWLAKIELVGPLPADLMQAAAYRRMVGA